MAIDNKIFTGGLNSDDEDRVMPNGDYRYALNIRNSKSDSDSYGAVENVKGNEKSPLTGVYLGSGTFKCIGAYDDKLNNKIYWFIWNDLDTHGIYEYDVVNNSVVVVIFGAALNFKKDKLIIEQNIAIIDGLMYWVNVKPYKINIAKAKAGLISGFDEQAILAAKAAPQYPPIAEFESDLAKKQNSVRGKLFQFRYKWIYDDNEESAWSPISKVPLPLNEGQYRPNGYYPTEYNNNIRIDIDLGSPQVKRIKIAFREGNLGDFYLLKDIDKTLNIVTPTSYNFFNDEAYSSLDNDGNKGMRLFDWMPLESNTQSLIDGNRIAYGGITENFDPVKIDIDIEQLYGVLPNTLPPDKAVIINNQYAPTGMYGVPLNNNSNANQFQSYFTEQTSGYYQIAGITQAVKWYKNNVQNSSGIPTFDATNIYNVTRNLNTRGWYDGDTDAIWVTQVHTLELLLKNSLNGQILEGTRIVLKINVSWYNFQNLAVNTRTFSFQEIALINDSATSILHRFKQQINNVNYIDPNVEITFGCSVGNWSRGYAAAGLQGNIDIANGINYGSILGIQIKGIVPSANVLFVGTDAESNFPCLINTQSVTIDTYSAWTTKSKKTLKSGANHGIGIVYGDGVNRSGLTNVKEDKSFYVEFPTERTIQNGFITDVTSLKLDIHHKAPQWATTWRVVYTGNKTIEKIDTTGGYKGFLQLKMGGISSASGINNALQASLSTINTYNNSTSEKIGLSYSFSKGDRIRFLKDSSGNYYQIYEDVEIISYDIATESLIFKKPLLAISGDIIVEIYTPKKTTSNEFYYEIGEVYRCDNGLHYGDINQVVDVNGIVITPASVTLDDIGDVYLRYRTSPMDTQIEDYAFSDFYDSDSWDKGRPNIVDNNIKQIYRPTTIRYSQPYIPETNINGLSRFDGFDFEAYDHQYGDIRLLYSSDRLLNVFQRLKVGRIGISQSTIYSADGSSAAVSRVDKVLNEIIYHAGEYGIGDNPESFAVYGNSKYFVDVKRGLVCRLGGDGVTPISEYKMHNYFTDMFEALDTNALPYKVIGTYDVRFDEYIIHITNGTIQATVAFSEGKNRWTTFYSYFPEYMISNRTGLISFFAGQLYRHNMNNLYNNFYGTQYSSKLQFISNVEPLKVKVFTNITQDTNSVFRIDKATNKNGQETNLEYTDFEDVEGVYKATLLKDINTPNVAEPLIEGDEMRDTFLDITIENESTDFVKLLSVGVGVTLSEMTNK